MLPTLIFSVAALGPPGEGNSAATITGSFSDSCRDFQAHSSKDISFVEVHYADGRVVKDEVIHSPDYSIDSGAGDEIDLAIVKSGTTRERFDCVSNSPPKAMLEILTPEDCVRVSEQRDFWTCPGSAPRTVWRDFNETF